MGFNDTVDVTIVGSGPNGLTAAVICARAGFFGTRLRGAANRRRRCPERPGPGLPRRAGTTSAQRCTRWHWRRRSSPSSTCAPAACSWRCPEISYANPLPNHPAAIGYRDLTRTCEELDDGASWRTLLEAARAPPRRGAEPVPRRQAIDPVRPAHRGARRAATAGQAGHPGVGPCCGARTPVRSLPALPHIRFRRCPRWCPSGAGLMLATLGHAVGWPIPSVVPSRSPTRSSTICGLRAARA